MAENERLNKALNLQPITENSNQKDDLEIDFKAIQDRQKEGQNFIKKNVITAAKSISQRKKEKSLYFKQKK